MQKLLKKVNNKGLKLQSYILGKKNWTNNKYIKINQNWKLKI